MCRPNCIAKLVDMKGQHRVLIFATQQIAPMEELTYALLPWAIETSCMHCPSSVL